MALIDEVVIHVESGAGGNGCVSFRREKYIPYGGPNGGNGGRGGDVFLVATEDKQSLLDFKYRPKFLAERGEHGQGSDCDGRSGEDLVIQVPVGTLIFDENTHELLADLDKPESSYMAAKGGQGGLGNMWLKTSTRRAPKFAYPGKAGQTKDLKLELRLMADVGLLGLPNAGKSSLLRVLSRAKPKVADYPFTTLQPHLGMVSHHGCSFIMADLPGLIEGASEGVGLGHQFLKHVSRNRILLHLVELSPNITEMKKQIRIVRGELKKFNPEMMEKPELLVFTKADLFPPDELKAIEKKLARAKLKGFIISSHSQYGIPELLNEATRRLKKETLH